MKLLIVNGPNLNFIGRREPSIYGSVSLDDYLGVLSQEFKVRGIELVVRQSNLEGEIVTFIQDADGEFEGIILNAGGYSHTSVAIADAIRAVDVAVVEVHISNIFAREEYRHNSITGAACLGSISGFGVNSYRLAVESFLIEK